MQLLFDYNHLAYRCFFAARRDIEDVGFRYLKHVMLNTIFSLCQRFNATEVIIAADSSKNWRKKIYPEYKGNRKENRDKQDDIDWTALYDTMDELLKELKAYFPFMVLRVEYMEADDIIAVIAKEKQHTPKTVVTSDGDYLQLLQYKNITIFDPIKNKKMATDDPIRDLKIKILTGDAGDNIPNIKPRLGEKTAEKWVANSELLKEAFSNTSVVKKSVKKMVKQEDGTEKEIEELIDETITDKDGKVIPLTEGMLCEKNYRRNTILIDLAYTPKKLIDVMNREIDEYIMADGKMIFNYFTQNQFREFMNNTERIDQTIAKLVEHQKQKETFG